MKIIFNGQGSGFGDNGGTATIYHSANMLHKLGHDVTLVSDKPTYFTWFGLEGPKYIKTQKYDFPDADVLIATGVGSVKHVMAASPKKGIKIWWVRAHETWMTKEDILLDIYRNRKLEIITNSICLQKFISRRVGRNTLIFRPGITLTDFFPERERAWDRKKKITLGALYNEKGRKRFKWVPEIYAQLRMKDEAGYRLLLFGTYDKPEKIKHDRYAMKPGPDTLRKFYNAVDIWLAPSKSEGLHIPPQEAMLCGCVVIGSNATLGGMADYLENHRTGFVVPDWPEAVQVIQGLVEEPNRTTLAGISKNGRAKIIELGDRRQNMQNFSAWLNDKVYRYRKNILALRRRGIGI